MPRFGTAVLGGTFDRFHVGHAALLAAAFAAGRTVAIGLTTPGYLAAHPKPDGGRIQPYATRRAAVVRWIRRARPHAAFRIVALRDPFGGSVGPGVDVLVVSAETRRGGAAVNRERRRRGLPAVPVVTVPIVLADDLGPVSSRRIRAGEIDRSGGRRAPIAIGLSVPPALRASAVRGVRRAFPTARLALLGGPFPRAGPPRRGLSRLAAAAGAGRDLGVAVRVGPAGDAWAAEATATVALAPTHLTRPDAGRIAAWLAPSRRRKSF